MNTPSRDNKRKIIEETGVSEVTLDRVIETFISGQSRKSKLISRAFNTVVVNEQINPSTAWNSVVKPVYIDIYDNINSWRSASGAAFREFILEYYNLRFPPQYKIESISNRRSKDIITDLNLSTVLPEHLNLIIKVQYGGGWSIIGAIHAHTSLRNRLSSVESVSKSLVESGYVSPVMTLDTQKELDAESQRSLNRELIENRDSFSNMYCYNTNVDPTTSGSSSKYIKTVHIPRDSDVFIKDIKEYSMNVDTSLLEKSRI